MRAFYKFLPFCPEVPRVYNTLCPHPSCLHVPLLLIAYCFVTLNSHVILLRQHPFPLHCMFPCSQHSVYGLLLIQTLTSLYESMLLFGHGDKHTCQYGAAGRLYSSVLPSVYKPDSLLPSLLCKIRTR